MGWEAVKRHFSKVVSESKSLVRRTNTITLAVSVFVVTSGLIVVAIMTGVLKDDQKLSAGEIMSMVAERLEPLTQSALSRMATFEGTVAEVSKKVERLTTEKIEDRIRKLDEKVVALSDTLRKLDELLTPVLKDDLYTAGMMRDELDARKEFQRAVDKRVSEWATNHGAQLAALRNNMFTFFYWVIGLCIAGVAIVAGAAIALFKQIAKWMNKWIELVPRAAMAQAGAAEAAPSVPTE